LEGKFEFQKRRNEDLSFLRRALLSTKTPLTFPIMNKRGTTSKKKSEKSTKRSRLSKASIQEHPSGTTSTSAMLGNTLSSPPLPSTLNLSPPPHRHQVVVTGAA
jgi:hypothetical protein